MSPNVTRALPPLPCSQVTLQKTLPSWVTAWSPWGWEYHSLLLGSEDVEPEGLTPGPSGGLKSSEHFWSSESKPLLGPFGVLVQSAQGQA